MSRLRRRRRRNLLRSWRGKGSLSSRFRFRTGLCLHLGDFLRFFDERLGFFFGKSGGVIGQALLDGDFWPWSRGQREARFRRARWAPVFVERRPGAAELIDAALALAHEYFGHLEAAIAQFFGICFIDQSQAFFAQLAEEQLPGFF